MEFYALERLKADPSRLDQERLRDCLARQAKARDSGDYLEYYQAGFDFAYTFPGLNKVIQAVGRVIRSETDRGVAILLDDRFTTRRYKQLYPKEWNHLKTINDVDELSSTIDLFWQPDCEAKS